MRSRQPLSPDLSKSAPRVGDSIAFERVLMASEQIGVRGLVVHAASPAAREFDRHMGFDPSPSDPNMLLLRLVDIAAILRG